MQNIELFPAFCCINYIFSVLHLKVAQIVSLELVALFVPISILPASQILPALLYTQCFASQLTPGI